MKSVAVLGLVGTVLFAAMGESRADTCWSIPGAQQGPDCGAFGNGAKPAANGTAPAQNGTNGAGSLREQLTRALAAGRAESAAQQQSADQLNQRVLDARARIDAALADPGAPGARQQYNAALSDLQKAYGDAIQAFPDNADMLQGMENGDVAAAAARAAAATWAAATPPAPTGPDNVTAIGSDVYVCDGAIAGANNVSCRDISAAGQCTNVTMADGDVGWQDSIPTPCQSNDLAQRAAYLAGHPDLANAINSGTPPFSMDPADTAAEVKRLLGDADRADWNAAMTDPPAPSIDTARLARPMQVDAAVGSGNEPSLDDAINVLGAAASILGAASGGLRSVPTVHVPTTAVRAPTMPTPSVPTVSVPTVSVPTAVYRPQPPANQSTITGTTGN